MEALVWFRSDLRLEDNPALRKAFENSTKVHAIFIFSKKQLKKHNEASVCLLYTSPSPRDRG